MALITVVRSLAGLTLELPGPVFIRPWNYVELTGPLSEEMRATLRVLSATKVVTIGQVLDGAPLSSIDLDRSG